MAETRRTQQRGAYAVLAVFWLGLVGQVLLFLAMASFVASARDDCDGVMAALVAAQNDVYTDLDNIGALEAAIAAPAWDPVLDGWMVPALGWANEDLIGDLNTASIAAEQAHQAHCY